MPQTASATLGRSATQTSSQDGSGRASPSPLQATGPLLSLSPSPRPSLSRHPVPRAHVHTPLSQLGIRHTHSRPTQTQCPHTMQRQVLQSCTGGRSPVTWALPHSQTRAEIPDQGPPGAPPRLSPLPSCSLGPSQSWSSTSGMGMAVGGDGAEQSPTHHHVHPDHHWGWPTAIKSFLCPYCSPDLMLWIPMPSPSQVP